MGKSASVVKTCCKKKKIGNFFDSKGQISGGIVEKHGASDIQIDEKTTCHATKKGFKL